MHRNKGICQSAHYRDKEFRNFKLDDSAHDVCLPFDFRRNTTIGNRGTVKLTLGHWFRPRTDFTKSKNRNKIQKLLKVQIERK